MILFSDFDDTLYTWRDLDQFPKNLDAIQKFRAAGNQFCLATGRSLQSVAEKFPNYIEYCDYMILDNGGICVDASGEIIFTYTIALDSVETMTKDLHKLAQDMIPVYYYNFDKHQNLAEPPTKIRYWVKDNNLAAKLTAEVNKKYDFRVYTYRNIMPNMSWFSEEELESYVAYSEVMSDKAGKETAVMELISNLNFPKSEIITVGDDWNDLKMIQKFNGYAVAHARPEILSAIPPSHIVESVAGLVENLL